MFELERPIFLFLLLALPALVWLERESLANLTRRRRLGALALRAGLLFFLTLALAGPFGLIESKKPNVIFLMDRSLSVDESARNRAEAFLAEAEKVRPPGQHSAVLGFADQVWVESGFSGERPPLPEPGLEATRLTEAILRSAAMFPDGPGRVVVLSDGAETVEPPPELRLPPKREWDAVPLPADSRPDVWIAEVAAPAQVRAGEKFNASVSVGSNQSGGTAEVALYQDGFLIGKRAVNLRKGNQTLNFQNLDSRQTRSRLEAAVNWPGDTQPRNDRLTAIVTSAATFRALLIDPEPNRLEPLARVLRDDQMTVEIRLPEAIPQTLEEWQDFDLLILSDTPATSLSSQTVIQLQTWVKDFGGGLIVTGGENSLGGGGYARSSLEALLPVRSEHEDPLESPVAALQVVLDRSGSMTAKVGDQTKMDLANQGAVMALAQLSDRDYFGVLAVDIRPQTVIALGPVGERGGADRTIRGIRSAGGGIYVYSALAEAYRQLRSVPAKIKHVILFADASDAEGKTGPGGQSAEALAATARGDQVTTSVVALGVASDKDERFLRSLAQAGDGRFYLTYDATTLPQLFALETQRATQSSLVEEPFIPEPGPGAERFGLDWNSAPPLLGYNAVQLQPGAEALLTAPGGDPLLAVWPMGIGRVAVFTSDAKSRWAAEWLNWPGFGKFWSQLARMVGREDAAGEWSADWTETAEELRVRIHHPRKEGGFKVQAVTASGAGRALEVRQIAPGEFEARVPKGDAGELSLAISENDRRSARFLHWSRGYSPEFRPVLDGESRLRERVELGKGKINPSPSEVWRQVAEADLRPVNLTPYFLIMALLLFLGDLANRRRPGN